MKKKFEVKLLKNTKDFGLFLGGMCGIEQLKADRDEWMKEMFLDFEVFLLSNLIMLKSRVLFVVNYTKSEKLENGIRNNAFFKVFDNKDAAREFLSQAKKEDFYASMCEYNFDKLIKMSDNEFESLPNLGNKELARKYREVMREQG